MTTKRRGKGKRRRQRESNPATRCPKCGGVMPFSKYQGGYFCSKCNNLLEKIETAEVQ